MSSTDKTLTILFTPLDGWGHINASHGIADVLKARGHRCVFALDVYFKDKLKQYGFEEELHSMPRTKEPEIDPCADVVHRNQHLFKMTNLEVNQNINIFGYESIYEDLKGRHSQYKQIIDRVKPDLIIVDTYLGCPAITHSGVPFVWLFSAAPLWALDNANLPPPWSGLPLNGNREEWHEYRSKLETMFEKLHNTYRDWYESSGFPRDSSESNFVTHPRSEHLNVYMYPKELDYKEVQPLPHNWRRVDAFVRKIDTTIEIPEQFSKRPGKLIFLSMGTIGCSHLELMTRLTRILSKSENKFIVTKGPLHDRYELYDNMWGQVFLPQLGVLPLVDLVITHGGNNTVTESFFYGKPMLVLPLFGDQFDNAQRITETGLGSRLSPFTCSEEELLTTVDQLVNNSELKKKMKEIGERIRNSKDKEMIADIIENIVK